MSWKVVWKPEAERRLTSIWLSDRMRQRITDATHEIDAVLATDPLNAGESRDGNDRVLLCQTTRRSCGSAPGHAHGERSGSVAILNCDTSIPRQILRRSIRLQHFQKLFRLRRHHSQLACHGDKLHPLPRALE